MERGRGGAGDDSVSPNCTGCSLCSVLVMSLGLSPTPTSATALRLCAYKRASLRVDRWQLSGCTCWGLGGGRVTGSSDLPHREPDSTGASAPALLQCTTERLRAWLSPLYKRLPTRGLSQG